jgi:phosphoglycolate phosphatase
VNILFDLDGTLTDPREGIVACFKHALSELGQSCPSDSEFERYIGPPLYESFGELLGSTERRWINDAVGLYRDRFSSTGMFENAVYPGMEPALAALRDLGATLFVATSKAQVFAERIVEHFGLDRFFRAVYGSELDGARTNKADLIAHILRAESISPPSALMVGDRGHDVLGAKANGVFPIGALWGYGSREELVAAGATLLCQQPSMLSDAASSALAQVNR